MNKLKINGKFYDVLDNGVNYSTEALQMAFVADGMTVDDVPKRWHDAVAEVLSK